MKKNMRSEIAKNKNLETFEALHFIWRIIETQGYKFHLREDTVVIVEDTASSTT